MKTGKVNFGLTYNPNSHFKSLQTNFSAGSYYPMPASQSTKKTEPENPLIKYSGVAALAAVVAAGAVMIFRGKSSSIAKLEQSVGNLTNTVNGLSQKVENLVAKTTSNETIIRSVEANATKMSESIKGILLFLTGGASVATGAKLINKYLDGSGEKDVPKFDESGKTSTPPPTTQIVYSRPVHYGITNSEVDVWGSTKLKLSNTKFVSKHTKAQMKEDVRNVMSGKTAMDDVKDPEIYSIAYEGWGSAVGGEADIANEIPVEFTKRGFDCIAFAPMFEAKNPNGTPKFHLRKDSETGKLYYKTDKKNVAGLDEFEVHKILDTRLEDGTPIQAYYSLQPLEKTPDNKPDYNGKMQKVIYLYDGGEQLNLGQFEAGKDTYTQRGREEKVRMGMFMRLSYEFIQKAKDGLITDPDGNKIKAPDKIIAHEAWQTAPLLGELRFLSRAQEGDGTITKDMGEYLRKLANNTMVVIHNFGNGYQGWIGGNDNIEVMEDYFNTIYGGYAKDIVENGIVDDVNGNKFFGQELQRNGFCGDAVNLAHSALCTATILGPVSKGYKNEIVRKGIAARLDAMVKVRDKNKGIIPMPNGVSRSDKVATKVNFDNNNKTGITGVAYLVDTEADIDKLDANNVETQNKFIEAKKQNKKVVFDLLKTMAADLKAGKPSTNGLFLGNIDIHGDAKNINLDGVNENTPVYYMASRLDPQKGFETAVLAFEKLYSDPGKYGIDASNLPVLLTSGASDPSNPASVKIGDFMRDFKNRLGDNGGRIIPVKNRMSASGLLLAGMAGTTLMPSDFEPYGISDVKGFYAGSHVVGNAVGGMQPIASVSRKMYDYNSDEAVDKEKANSILVSNDEYEPLCLLDDNDVNAQKRAEMRDRNADRLAYAIAQDCQLAKNNPNEIARMDINAIKTNVSWDQGAFDNYLKVLKIDK